MSMTFKKIIRAFNLFTGFFPTAIPIGMTAYNKWADSIISTYGLPDNDSVRWAIASVILHLGPQAAFRSRFYFYLTIRAGASKQVAGAVFQDLKNKDNEARRAAAATEVTVQPTGSTSNVTLSNSA